MIPFKLHQPPLSFSISQTTTLHLSLTPRKFSILPLSPTPHKPTVSLKPSPFSFPIPLSYPTFKLIRVSKAEAPFAGNEGGYTKASPELEDLSPNGAVYRKTLALVECSMFAALTGLVYFLSNSLAIEVCGAKLKNGSSSIQLKKWNFRFVCVVNVVIYDSLVLCLL